MHHVTVPTHLNHPDQVLFGLTARQLLILLSGLSSAYLLWQGLAWLDPFGPLGRLLPTLPLLPATLLLAFVRLADRSLEAWGLILLRFLLLPRHYVWHKIALDEPEPEDDPWKEDAR